MIHHANCPLINGCSSKGQRSKLKLFEHCVKALDLCATWHCTWNTDVSHMKGPLYEISLLDELKKWRLVLNCTSPQNKFNLVKLYWDLTLAAVLINKANLRLRSEYLAFLLTAVLVWVTIMFLFVFSTQNII